jgi:hypothetical protein
MLLRQSSAARMVVNPQKWLSEKATLYHFHRGHLSIGVPNRYPARVVHTPPHHAPMVQSCPVGDAKSFQQLTRCPLFL